MGRMNIFMDSGAYSAWSKGAEIDLQKYIEFLHKYKDDLTVYANLDVIGDPEATWKNQTEMEKQGLSPMPIFHRGSSKKYLKKCMEYEYFALGAIAKSSRNERINYLDMVFKEIGDKNGVPQNKVHGLGTTAFALMRRYPFYSVDSTSWILTGAMGIILVPQKSGDGYDFSKDPYKIAVSDKSPKKGKGQHFDSLSLASKMHAIEYIESMGYKLGEKGAKKGTEECGLYTNDGHRIEMNSKYFIEFQKTVPEWPWAFGKKDTCRRLF